MSNTIENRIDEVSKYYQPAVIFEKVMSCLFYVIAITSIFILFEDLPLPKYKQLVQSGFIVVAIVYFIISQTSRFYLIPKAEKMRRRQMLSNSFGAPISHDNTSLYYNNQYEPSIQRLGANTFENSLFSKEIASKMLFGKRLITGIYFLAWLIAFTLSQKNIEVLICITQLFFSGEILAQWINLEVLRFRHESTYDQLHNHYYHRIGDDSNYSLATILDAFVSYESAKSSAGLLLSSKTFNNLNPSLTDKWNQIRKELKMDFQPDISPDS